MYALPCSSFISPTGNFWTLWQWDFSAWDKAEKSSPSSLQLQTLNVWLKILTASSHRTFFWHASYYRKIPFQTMSIETLSSLDMAFFVLLVFSLFSFGVSLAPGWQLHWPHGTAMFLNIDVCMPNIGKILFLQHYPSWPTTKAEHCANTASSSFVTLVDIHICWQAS